MECLLVIMQLMIKDIQIKIQVLQKNFKWGGFYKLQKQLTWQYKLIIILLIKDR